MLRVNTCFFSQFWSSLLILLKSSLIDTNLWKRKKKEKRERKKRKENTQFSSSWQNRSTKKVTCRWDGWNPRRDVSDNWSLDPFRCDEGQFETRTPQWSWSTETWEWHQVTSVRRRRRRSDQKLFCSDASLLRSFGMRNAFSLMEGGRCAEQRQHKFGCLP